MCKVIVPMFGNPSLCVTNPQFFDHPTRYCVFNPNMLILLKSKWLGEHSPIFTFLILVYGKKSNFRAGTPNLSIKSE